MSSDIIIHHRSNAYESFPTGPFYVTLPLLLSLLLLLPLFMSLLLLLPLLPLLSHYFATDTLLQILSLSGVVELTTQLLILENILLLPLVSNQQIWVEYSTLADYCDPLYLWVINAHIGSYIFYEELHRLNLFVKDSVNPV